MITLVLKSPDYLKHIQPLISSGKLKDKLEFFFERINKNDPIHIGSLETIIKIIEEKPNNIHVNFQPINGTFLTRIVTVIELLIYRKKISDVNDYKFQISESYKKNFAYRWSKNILIRFFDKFLINISVKFINNIIYFFLESNLKHKIKSSRKVIFLPFIFPGSIQQIIASSIYKKKRTLGLIASWDNLSTKGFIFTKVDVLTVWNKYQIEELKTLQNYTGNAKILGSLFFKNYFENKNLIEVNSKIFKPKKSLNILYLGSSKSTSPFDIDISKAVFSILKKILKDYDLKFTYRPHPRNDEAHMKKIPNFVNLDKTWKQGESNKLYKTNFNKIISQNDLIVGVNSTSLFQAALLGGLVLIPDLKKFLDHKNIFHFRYIEMMISNNVFYKIDEMTNLDNLKTFRPTLTFLEKFLLGTNHNINLKYIQEINND